MPKSAAKQHAYYLAHRAEILARVTARAQAKRKEIAAYKKRHAAANADKIAAQRKAFRLANKERIAEQKRLDYAGSPAKAKARARAYRIANPTKVKLATQKWCKENRNRLAIMKREWDCAAYRAHPERYREIQSRRKAQKLGTMVERVNFKQILRDSKGLCGICKKPLDLFGIDFDHIIPLSKGGSHTRENLQATHSYCNRSKGSRIVSGV